MSRSASGSANRIKTSNGKKKKDTPAMKTTNGNHQKSMYIKMYLFCSTLMRLDEKIEESSSSDDDDEPIRAPMQLKIEVRIQQRSLWLCKCMFVSG